VTVRVLYLIDSLGVGGAERGLVLNLLHLDRTRFEPEVAILGTNMTLAPELQRAHFPIHQLHAGRGPRALAKVLAVRRLLRDGKFDVVHSSLVWASIVGNLAGMLARVKVVEHVVNVDPEGRQAATLSQSVARKTRLVAGLSAWIGRFAVDRYVSISRAATELARWSWMRDPRRVTLVPRGQDLDALASRARSAPDPALELVAPEGPILLTVGRLFGQKGHHYLLEAMPLVLAEHPSAQLLIAGDGNLRGMLEREAARLELDGHVQFLGIRNDVPALLARADVFVFPSLWEGQGNAVVEAAALGKPIVATQIAAMTETFTNGESALLVPAADATRLARALNRVLSDEALAKQLGAAAAERARGRFDIRATTEALEHVYDELLAGSA